MSPAEELTAKLKGKWLGSYGRAKCPCHDDHNPSLDIKNGNRGAPIVTCRSQGCNSADIVARCRELGFWPEPGSKRPTVEEDNEDKWRRFREAHHILRVASGFRPSGPVRESYCKSRRPIAYFKGRGLQCPPTAMLIPADEAEHLFGKRQPVAVLPILGGGGKFQGVHCTFLNKTATAKATPKGSRKIYGFKKGGYIPLGETDPKSPLIVGEGVETTLSAMALSGYPGAAAIDAGNFNSVELPASSEIIIARDRGVAGRKAAETLAARYSSSRPVRTACPPRGDWNDCIQNDTLDQRKLRRRLLNAKVKSTTKKFVFTLPEFHAVDIPPAETILDPILRIPGRSMLSARAGHLKTRLALSIAYAAATGRDLMDWRVNRPCRVLYVDAELDPGTFKEWTNRLGSLPDNLFVLSDKMLAAQSEEQRVSFATSEDRKFMSEMVRQIDPDLIILDSLFELSPPDMASGKDPEGAWPEVRAWIEQHSKLERRHILVLHHDNKSGQQFGSSHKERDFDLMMQLRRQDNLSTEDRVAVQLSFTKPRHLSPLQAATRILTVNTDGEVEWERSELNTHPGPIAGKHHKEVRDLLDEGWRQKDIADKLGISRGRVSQIVKELSLADA